MKVHRLLAPNSANAQSAPTITSGETGMPAMPPPCCSLLWC